ncbi:hypothetical protein [uncultured Dokdonia sp.]|uniref:hypothetical protein n=1 Tax=uncultured Dokdonia sp. TaxID=575653 RepID=UPI00260D692A|nr:hypothetical protein [uncultured Dokdonia sp.]
MKLHDEIVMKELDLIDQTISRLDKQIQTSKTVCITLWTAWIGWFIVKVNTTTSSHELGLLIVFSAVFPIIFWKVDSYYRAAVISSSKRQSLISLYLNLSDETIKFPILDPVGRLYDDSNYDALLESSKDRLSERSYHELKNKNLPNRYTYKEVVWFYLPLMIVSLALGGYFLL